MTTFAQNVSAREAEELLGYPVQLEANDTVWSDAVNKHYAEPSVPLASVITALTRYGMVSEIELADVNYGMSAIHLARNATVGPAQCGAIVTSGFGGQLFLSDPHLPANVLVGPISYAVIASGTRAVGFIPFESIVKSIGEPSKPGVWTFMADPYHFMGLIFRGERPAFVGLTVGKIRDAFVNVSSGLGDIYESFYGTATSTTKVSNETTPTPSSKSASEPAIVNTIRAVHRRTILEGDAIENALHAVREACAFAERELSNDMPLVMVSDDGVVMLQWRKGDRGVLLIFTGDGTVSLSIKKAGGRYATSREEFQVADHLPVRARTEIDNIVAG